MNQGLIPRRYAKALFMLAKEQGCDSAVYDAMRRLSDAFAAEPGLQKAMANPYVDEADRRQLIIEAARPEGKAAQALADMAKLLERNRRAGLVREVALAYIGIYRSAHRIYSVVISSAAPLARPELERIEALIKKHLPTDATAETTERTEPELIGGFTVGIDNELLDASVANELKQLRLKLLSH